MSQPLKVLIVVDGGNVQTIVTNGDVEITVVDFDNATEDAEFDAEAVETMLEPSLEQGTDESFAESLDDVRGRLEDVAKKAAPSF